MSFSFSLFELRPAMALNAGKVLPVVGQRASLAASAWK
jgi:hypothetical protein